MSFDYRLIGGQAAGGENSVFESKAREAQLGEFLGRGFLVVDENDVFKRRAGHARLPLSAADEVSLRSHKKDEDGQPLRWRFRGTVYTGDVEVTEELDVHISSFSFSDTVRVSLHEAPPLRS